MPPKKTDAEQHNLTTRSLSLRLLDTGTPATLDEKTRSVGVIAATETPVDVYDYDRREVIPEVLLMSGCIMPASRQVPLLDSHSRYDTSTVIGSCRELQVEKGQLVGRAHYSEVEAVGDIWQKTCEGHLTDYSIGYRVLAATYIPDGEKAVIDGRSFEGPVKVATSWKIRELSACPIGADEIAKARAATGLPQPHIHSKKENAMDQKIRAFLESRGLSKTATEEEALRFLETLDVRSEEAGDTMTVDEARKMATDATRAEVDRRENIRSMCDHYGYADLASELITGGKSEDEARAAVMKKHMGEETSGQNVGHRGEIVIGADATDKFRAAGQDAILLRAGLITDHSKAAPGALDLRGYSLVEMARESLRMAGRQHTGAAMQMVGRALTTSDFPILLGNVANLSLMAGWDAAEETFEQWADASGSVSDFKIHTLARAGETDDLDEIDDDNEYKYGSLGEQSEQFKLATYGKLNRIGRQAIINDELGAITTAFQRRGESAARKVGDIAYAVLTANAAMGDGVALFHSTHGNLGTTGAISETTMAQMEELLGLQKDISGKRRLNLPVRTILAPLSVKGAAEVFFNSNQFAGADTATTRTNPFAGTKYGRVYDARLDDDSVTAWYALGPKGKTIKIFYLNGNRTPYLETKQGWSIDGVEFKTRIDAAAKAVDWRGMAKNSGA